MFASKTITEHLLRGVFGVGCFVVAVAGSSTSPWLTLVLLPFALLALRGCPMCWTLGLAETIAARFTGRPKEGACVDGQCARINRTKDSSFPEDTDLLKGSR
jgi:hypothetical protein